MTDGTKYQMRPPYGYGYDSDGNVDCEFNVEVEGGAFGNEAQLLEDDNILIKLEGLSIEAAAFVTEADTVFPALELKFKTHTEITRFRMLEFSYNAGRWDFLIENGFGCEEVDIAPDLAERKCPLVLLISKKKKIGMRRTTRKRGM